MPDDNTVAAGKTDDGTNHSWEATGGHIWEQTVREDAQGNIVVDAEESFSESVRKRRKVLELQDYSQRNRRVVRDMIRYVYIVLDASRWMRVKDPVFPGNGTRVQAVVKILTDFVQEYFDQNPVSHMGLVLVQQGEATQLHGLSGNSKSLKISLQSVAELCNAEGPQGGGEFSLQNGLEVAGRSLGHQPRHGSREVVVVTAALSTCDPGYLLTETLPKLQQASIRVSCIALAAELHVCRKLTDATSGVMGVCLDQQYLRDWMMAQCTPPPTSLRSAKELGCEMIRMGFPSRTVHEIAELVHAGRAKTLLSRTAFTCPQCQAKNSELPADCAVCGLKLVLAPHLARSFHHLFPVPPFHEKSWTVSSGTAADVVSSSLPKRQDKLDDKLVMASVTCPFACFACLRNLNPGTDVMRFECPECKSLFCVDCDAYLHHSLHNCPGCLSR